ncbi:MAG: hypothetical protein ACETWM_15985 [Candidatus Lokiarchaeia archaeon]
MSELEYDKVWLFQWFLQIVGRIQKILGKDYMKIALQHMGNYLSSRTGEKAPNFESVDKFRDYGLQIMGKIEDPWNAVLYGLLEGDRDYRASLKRGESGFNKVAELVLDASLVGKEPFEVSEILEAAQKFLEYLMSIRLDVPTSYQQIDSDALYAVVSNCIYKECCRTVQAGRLLRGDGTPFCWVLKMNCSGILKLSGVSVDYRLIDFDSPACRGLILKY